MAANAPTPRQQAVRLARAVRRLLRWSLLVGVVSWMALWVWTFDAGGFPVVMGGAVLWYGAGVVGAVALLAEILAANRLRGEPTRVRPSWGLLLWVLAPVVFGLCSSLHIDARLWFVMHRPTLEAAAMAWRRGPVESARLGGFEIERSREPDAVWFVTSDFLDVQGFVHDPSGAVRLRDECCSGYRVRCLLELGGGWRVFWASG